MIAVIGGAEPASIALHAACGFEEVGQLRSAGWKHGRWLDNVYMQMALGKGSSEPPANLIWGRLEALPLGKAKGGQGFLCRSGRAAPKTRGRRC